MTAILVHKEMSDTGLMRKLNIIEEELKAITVLDAYHELKNINVNKNISIFDSYEIVVN